MPGLKFVRLYNSNLSALVLFSGKYTQGNDEADLKILHTL